MTVDNHAQSIHRRRRLPIVGASDRVRRPKKPSPAEPLILSASELKTFLRCRVKWSWRYHHGLQPKEKAVPLIFGGLGHDVLRMWYLLSTKKRTTKAMRRIAKNAFKHTRPEELSVDDFELLEAMLIGYASWAIPRDRELGVKGVKPELFFNLPLVEDGSIRVRGYIDAVFKQSSLKSTLGCFEHKFKKQIKVDIVDMNLQISVYLWAMSKLFPKKKRFIGHYQVLRKQRPSPRVRSPLFARESVERSMEEIHQWEIDTQRAALDMLDAAIYPNPMDACSWDCDYQTPCLLRGRPHDVQHVLDTHFTSREKR